MNWVRLFPLAMAATVWVGGSASAEPDWMPRAPAAQPRLKSIYTEEHALPEFVDAKARALVLVFMGIDCPVVRQYVPRLNHLAGEFSDRGVRFLAVYANAGDNVLSMAHHAEQSDLVFPAMLDGKHNLADLLQVKVMSEVVVLDRDLNVRYQGAIDNQFKKRGNLNAPTENYLADALAQMVVGKPVERPFMPASGCRIERNDPIVPNDQLTFHKDIVPLLQKHCQSCHRSGEVAPFELSSYDDVYNYAETIEEVVLDRRMPPWHGILNEKFGKLQNDKRLSDGEVRTFVAWIRAGMPEGDARVSPPPIRWPDPTAWAIGKPDFVYRMVKPFAVPATGVINYQFFRVPMNLREDRWVQAIEVRPGNRQVVHHIGLHIVPSGNQDFSGLAMAILFGLTGDQSVPLNDYVPGDVCNHKEYPPQRAVRIPRGSDLIFEVHYTPNGKATTDRSEVAIRWAKNPPTDEVLTKVFRKKRGGFRIPAGEPHHRMVDEYYFERDVLIDSIRPHLHNRGKSYRVELVERDPKTDEITHRETVLSIPNYDVNWQRTYELETPLSVPAGAELVATAHFDNSRFNPNNPDPTADVFWGLQTTDEMFSTRIQYRIPR
jgi:hypothetical protein